MIDSFLIADPPLKQVVSHTYEAGLRGTIGDNDKTGRLTWGLGGFRTSLTNDILNIASTIPMFGYFQNIPKDLREGIEAKVNYKRDRLNLYANYTFIDATYQTTVLYFLTQQSVRGSDDGQHPGDAGGSHPRHPGPSFQGRF